MKKYNKSDYVATVIFAVSVIGIVASLVTLMWTESDFWLKMTATFVGSALLSFLAIRTT